MHFGIDYGSKLAGTTVICMDRPEGLELFQSAKKKDADTFVQQSVAIHQPDFIMLDAPLSLPSAYFGQGEDFFYRQCDRELKAMSPMFLGGLTARAMKLNKQFQNTSIEVFETYPGHLARSHPELNAHYQKKGKQYGPFLQALIPYLPLPLLQQPENWHQIDAVLAWWSGYRRLKKQAQIYGQPEEGLIYS
ncbi:MAG: DUF429 domain-containing protein [Bacteroidota bacterium]